MSTSSARTRRLPWMIVALVCGVVLVPAAFLPWRTRIFGRSLSGLDASDNASLTLLLGVAITICSIVWLARRTAARGLPIATLVLASIAVLAGLTEVGDLSQDADRTGGSIGAGIGLALTLLAALAATAASIVAVSLGDRQPDASAIAGVPTWPAATPPGWYPDGTGHLQYWDGVAWTGHRAPPPG